MRAPEIQIPATVTAATATLVTITPNTATDGGAIVTATDFRITGTTLTTQFAVGDRLLIRLNAM